MKLQLEKTNQGTKSFHYANLRNQKKMKKAQMVLRALYHPLRRNMILLIAEHDGICVTDIYIRLRMQQAVASQHLAILKAAKILKFTTKGKFHMYHINYDTCERINKILKETFQ